MQESDNIYSTRLLTHTCVASADLIMSSIHGKGLCDVHAYHDLLVLHKVPVELVLEFVTAPRTCVSPDVSIGGAAIFTSANTHVNSTLTLAPPHREAGRTS